MYIFIHIYANKQLENYDIMRENVVQRAVGVAGNGEEIWTNLMLWIATVTEWIAAWLFDIFDCL